MYATTDTVGLRERKKRATRAALGAAALELSVERGIDAVTVDDIAARADVSPRTFFNYFSSKEEAVLADGVERARGVVAALAQRPDDEPLWDALRAAFAQVLAGRRAPERQWLARVRLVKSSPALASQHLANFATMEQMLSGEIARRCGEGVDALYPRLVAAAAVMSVRVATTHWIETPDDSSLWSSIDRALTLTGAGLPPPVPA